VSRTKTFNCLCLENALSKFHCRCHLCLILGNLFGLNWKPAFPDQVCCLHQLQDLAALQFLPLPCSLWPCLALANVVVKGWAVLKTVFRVLSPTVKRVCVQMTEHGQGSFYYAGPAVWNSLLQTLPL